MKIIESYLRHIEDVCGGEGRVFQITDKDEKPPVSVVSYENVPEEKCTTAFSFGLSSVDHKEWIASRPELVISINSLDTAWLIAMGEMIRNGRDRCLFSCGMILNFGQKVSDESEMSRFLVFACSVLDVTDQTIQLPDRKVHLSQLYPVHEAEVKLIKDIGAERFMTELGIDFFDVKRGAYVRA